MGLAFAIGCRVFCRSLVVLLFVIAGPLRADPVRILELLQTDALFDILQQEGVAYGEDLATELFEAGPDPIWRAEVSMINAPTRLRALFEEGFVKALSAESHAGIVAFYTTDLGQRIVTLELEARRAMLDKAVEDVALAEFDEAFANGDPRATDIVEFMQAADLIEPNVSGGLNANLAFYRALVDGGAFPYEITEQDMLTDVWAQEAQVREEMLTWLGGYLYLAYGPLGDDELATYRAFATSPDGHALTTALFAGFDPVFARVSQDLGAAAARRMSGQEL